LLSELCDVPGKDFIGFQFFNLEQKKEAEYETIKSKKEESLIKIIQNKLNEPNINNEVELSRLRAKLLLRNRKKERGKQLFDLDSKMKQWANSSQNSYKNNVTNSDTIPQQLLPKPKETKMEAPTETPAIIVSKPAVPPPADAKEPRKVLKILPKPQPNIQAKPIPVKPASLPVNHHPNNITKLIPPPQIGFAPVPFHFMPYPQFNPTPFVNLPPSGITVQPTRPKTTRKPQKKSISCDIDITTQSETRNDTKSTPESKPIDSIPSLPLLKAFRKTLGICENGTEVEQTPQSSLKQQPHQIQLLRSIVEYKDRSKYVSSPVTFSSMEPNHVKQINSLLQRCFWPNIDVSIYLKQPKYTIVALYKKLVVGFGVISPNKGYIHYLVTQPPWRHCGIATHMIQYLIKQFKQHAANKAIVTIHVPDKDSTTIAMMQKLGFTSRTIHHKGFFESLLCDTSPNCTNILDFVKEQSYDALLMTLS